MNEPVESIEEISPIKKKQVNPLLAQMEAIPAAEAGWSGAVAEGPFLKLAIESNQKIFSAISGNWEREAEERRQRTEEDVALVKKLRQVSDQPRDLSTRNVVKID